MDKKPNENLDMNAKMTPEFIQEAKKAVLRMAEQMEKNKNQSIKDQR